MIRAPPVSFFVGAGSSVGDGNSLESTNKGARLWAGSAPPTEQNREVCTITKSMLAYTSQSLKRLIKEYSPKSL